MKSILTLLLFAYSAAVVGQSSDTLVMSKMSEPVWSKNYSNSTKFGFVKFQDGSVLAVGDKMKIGVPSGSNQSSSQSVGLAGTTTHRMNNFTFIMLGKMASAVLSGITYLPESFKGRELSIQNIKFYKSNRKDRPSVASLIFQNPGMDVTILDLKSALEFGELINPRAPMSSDQALTELKKAKDKLDLGLITQSKYDSLKDILSKHIH